MLHNFLSRPLSFLGWTTAMLFWLDFPSNTIKPLQMIQNCSGTTGLQRAKKSPCYTSLYLIALANQWQLASSSRHWCLHTERPQAQHPPTFHSLLRIYIPSRVWDLLVSDALWYHHREAQNHSPEHSRSPFLDGGIIFPPLSGMLDPCQSSSNNWKLISFDTTWLHPKHKKKKKT